MYIFDVIPITTSYLPGDNTLTYFSNKQAAAGSLITITLRNKDTVAVVTKVSKLKSVKQALKNSSYRLKKVNKVLYSDEFISKYFLKSAHDMSKYSMVNISAVLKTFIPANAAKLNLPPVNSVSHTPTAKNFENYIIGDEHFRLNRYLTAKKDTKSNSNITVIICPTLNSASFVKTSFDRLNQECVKLTTDQSVKSLKISLLSTLNNKKQQIIICTPVFIGLLSKLDCILIVEDATNPNYRKRELSNLNVVSFIKLLSKNRNTPVIFGQYLITAEDIAGIDAHKHRIAIQKEKRKTLTTATNYHDGSFKILSAESARSLNTSVKSIIFTNRKGYYPSVVCKDCGEHFRCKTCSSIITLKLYGDTRKYHCKHCDQSYTATGLCGNCGGYNTQGYGFGTQRILSYVNKNYPDRNIFLYDSDAVKTKKQKAEVINGFENSKNGILITTELIADSPSIRADFVIVLGIDGLLSIPDMRINEHLFWLLSKLRYYSRGSHIFVQTKFEEHPLFYYFKNNDYLGFAKNELKERMKSKFPPYSVLIKCKIKLSNAPTAAKNISNIISLFKRHKVRYETFKPPGNERYHIILGFLQPQRWLNNENEMKKELKSLNRSIAIEINPHSIL